MCAETRYSLPSCADRLQLVLRIVRVWMVYSPSVADDLALRQGPSPLQMWSLARQIREMRRPHRSPGGAVAGHPGPRRYHGGVSNWWGQPRPDGDQGPTPEAHAEPTPVAEPVLDEAPTTEVEPEPVAVATRDDLPTMAQLDALSAELDEIDAALAALDADPSLPGRAAAQNA